MAEMQTKKVAEEKLKKKGIFSRLPFFSKLRSIKNIEFIIAGVLGIIVLVIFLSSCETSKLTASKKSKTQTPASTKYVSSISEYSKELETRLENILSNIKGSGKLSVMVVVDSSPLVTFAEHLEEKVSGTGDNLTKTIVRYPITLENGSLESTVVLVEHAPKVKGVLVVAKGASDPRVKLRLISAVQALLNIKADLIEVIEGE